MSREPFSKDDAELALAVLLEPLAEGVRVLWVGEPTAAAERLAAVASAVEALSTGPRRTRGGKRTSNIKTRGMPMPGETYGLVVAPDLDDEGRAEMLTQWVDPSGTLAVSTAASPASYQRLERELGASMGRVRIVGQTRFAGFALVDFDKADGSDVTFDGTAIDDTETPVRWIAIAGSAVDAPVLSPYLVVQTPAGNGTAERTAERSERVPSGALEREVEASRARLEHAEKRLEQAQREIARSSQKLDELRHQLEEAGAARAASEAQLAEGKREHHALVARLGELERHTLSPAEAQQIEQAYVELEARLRAQAGELTLLRTELERRAVLVRDLVEELSEARRGGAGPAAVPPATPSEQTLSEIERLKAQLASLLRRVADAEGNRAAAQFRADELHGRFERAEAERARLEALIAERPTDPRAPVGRESIDETALANARAEAQAQLASAFAEERHALVQRGAEAEGRVRGLLSRLAELDERRSLAEARVALLEADLAQSRRDATATLARLEETREALDVARMAPPFAAEQARREGELMGTLSRTREALLGAQEEREQLLRELNRVRSGLLGVEQESAAAQALASRELSALRSEVDVLRSSESTTRTALAQLRDAHEGRLAALDSLEGERNGLRMRLDDSEAALSQLTLHLDGISAERDAARLELGRVKEALAHAERATSELAESQTMGIAQQVATLEEERSEARKIGILLGDVERDLELLRKERDAEAARASEALAQLAHAGESEAARAAAWVARLSSRDALIARQQAQGAAAETQMAAHRAELAQLEERLFRADEQRAAEAAVHEVQRAEDVSERARLADAASAARAQADREKGRASTLRSLLMETRQGLGRLVEGLKAPDPKDALQGAGGGAEIASLRRELDDRAVMLRSLTAQLEERDERLRLLEGGSVGQAAQAMGEALRNAEEREARLTRELELASERRTAAMEREAEVRRLEQELEARDSQFMTVEGELEQSHRLAAGLRDQLAMVGSELEALVHRASTEPPALVVEKLGQLLRALRR